jgi:flagellar basal-body rod protein FlgB
MNDITSDRSIMSALGRRLSIEVAKQSVAASNLANMNTPNYRTREVSFDDALNQTLPGTEGLAVTQPGHISTRETIAPTHEVQDAEGLPSRRDGNNVQLDRELLQMSRASTDFTAAQTALSAKFRLVRYAINEGK